MEDILEESGGIKNYLDSMSKNSTWGDGIILAAAVHCYKRPIVVALSLSNNVFTLSPPENLVAEPLYLGYTQVDTNNEAKYSSRNHYVSLHRKTHLTTLNEQVKSTIDTECSNYEPFVCNATTRTSNHKFESAYSILKSDIPHHPDVSIIPPQKTGKNCQRTLNFQNSWFIKYPWLHYSNNLKGVLCFYCSQAEALKLNDLATKREPAFTTEGFRNWKKALEKFAEHAKCKSHIFSCDQLHQETKAEPINNQLLSQCQQTQQQSKKCLMAVFTSVMFLARQGLALRGHKEADSNVQQLLSIRRQDIPELDAWLKRKVDMTSPSIQNEILQLFSNNIVHDIATKVLKSGMCAVIVDGTQDISGKEQLSVCIRYIDNYLCPREDFIGLYEPPSTTGECIAQCILDILLRLQLPINMLYGQTYDGASNMAGNFKDCQAIIAQKQPLALYVHCGAHAVNLVAQTVADSAIPVRDAMHLLHELGTLFSQSIKCRTAFANIAEADDNILHTKKIRPLCPTRWLVRIPAIIAMLEQYEAVLKSLEEMAVLKTNVSARASGLLKQFSSGSTLLALKMAQNVFSILETLNRSMQSSYQTVAGMCIAVDEAVEDLMTLRTEDTFDNILNESERLAEAFGLEPITVSRQRKPPKHFASSADAHTSSSSADFYRPVFFELIDHAVQQLKARFAGEGLTKYQAIENVLLSGEIGKALDEYTFLDATDLRLQLPQFRRRRPVKSVLEAVNCFREMVPEVRGEYSEVEKLVRLLLVCPASSAAAERSFSSLRRLKTWLRSTMTQKRLNSVAVCHIHKSYLDALDLESLLHEFIIKCENRITLFGRN